MMLYRRWIVLVFALLLLFPVIVSAQDSAQPVEIKVMSFNIWVGGDLVNFNNVIAAIQAADADIVGMQEPTGNLRAVADALGWHYASDQTHIISRFPLIDVPEANGAYVLAEISPGQVVAVANVHLPSDPYGGYAVRDGAPLADVIALEEQTRLSAFMPTLEPLQTLIAQGYPVLLTGDFNTPSHLDWTDAAVQARGLAYPVAWPVTVAAENAGLVDTYRAIHPDPVANAGITWTYGYPYPRLNEGEMLDRIDLVFASQNVEVLDSGIVGPSGTPDATITLDPYPSDHRAVVSTVRLTPVTPPVFVAPERRDVEQGSVLTVRYHAPSGEGVDRIAINTTEGATVMWLPPYEASFFGSVDFGTGTLLPGEYHLVLYGDADSILSRSVFWVTAPGAVPIIYTDKVAYAVGESVLVTWENAPANRFDWIGVYYANDPDLYNGYLAFAYTGATVNGGATLDAATLGELPPGVYELRLMLDDGYIALASVTFSISAP